MAELKVVGRSTTRADLVGKVTGATQFCADINHLNQLYAAVFRSPIPHGIITSIDTSAAAAMPGVRAIVTGDEVPYRFGRFVKDQPFLAIGRVRYVGEPIVAIAADTQEIAQAAAEAVRVELEELPVVDDMMEAIKPGSPLLHECWSDYTCIPGAKPVDHSNICDHAKLRKGDVEAGFREADVIVENEYFSAMTSHAVIETHTATAKVDLDGKITVWTPAQSPFYVRGELADALGLPEHNIRIIVPQIGGGFGGKLEVKAEPIAIALAMKTRGKPVKISYSRADDFFAGVVRAPVRFVLKTGAKRDGTITALQAEAHWDTGAYSTTGPRVNSKATVIVTGPYDIPNVKSDGYTVVTNRPLGTAYRGFGVAEAAYAQEQQMNAVADALGMDALELRMKNILVDGKRGPSGEEMFSVGVKECLVACATSIGWDEGPARWVDDDGKIHAKGFGTFIKSTGTPSYSSATLKLNLDGTVTISQGGTELGQGMTTIMPMIVSEELGIPVDKINMARVDTENVPPDKTTTSSRLTFHMGNAMLLAANDVKEKLFALAADVWGVRAQDIGIVDGVLVVEGDENRRIPMDSIGDSGLLKKGPPIVGFGSYETSDKYDKPDPETGQSNRLTVMWFMGATAAEVVVDPVTGKVRVVRLAIGNDVGQVINPLGCYQQVEGGAIMGIGNTLLEEMIFRDGRLLNGNMVDFKVPTSMDADVEIISHLIETPHPEGPFGAKGLGEPAMCAVQAAISSAVQTALEQPVGYVPIKPEHVVETCKAKGWR